MFKLYKKLRPIDWVLLVVLVGLTVLQVYCTMTLADFVQDIIKDITYLSYHNNPLENLSPEMLPVYTTLLNGSWENCTADVLTPIFAQIVAVGQMTQEEADIAVNTLIAIANVTTGDIWYHGGMMLLVAAGSMGCQICIGLISSFVSSNHSANIRSAIYKKVDGFSIFEREKFSTPSLITRTTNDVQQVQMANILMLRMAVAAPITAIWAVCKIQAASSQLTIATAVAMVLLIVFLILLMIFVLPKFKIMQKLIDGLNGVSRENLTGIRVVRAYNAEGYQEKKFGEANEKITKTQLFTSRMMSLLSPVMMLIMNGITLAIYWLGASLINAGDLDLATMTAFTMLASQIIMSFMMLMFMFVLMPPAHVTASRIN